MTVVQFREVHRLRGTVAYLPMSRGRADGDAKEMGWSHQILARADHQPARAAQLHRRVPGLRDQCRRADSQAFREPHKFAGAFRSCRSSARSSERSERCRTYVILRCSLYTSPAKLTLQASSRFDHMYYHSAEFVAYLLQGLLPLQQSHSDLKKYGIYHGLTKPVPNAP